jgi:hypothetical protein
MQPETEQDLQEWLQEKLTEIDDETGSELFRKNPISFYDWGAMDVSRKGLVIQFANGAEFQISIVQTSEAEA